MRSTNNSCRQLLKLILVQLSIPNMPALHLEGGAATGGVSTYVPLHRCSHLPKKKRESVAEKKISRKQDPANPAEPENFPRLWKFAIRKPLPRQQQRRLDNLFQAVKRRLKLGPGSHCRLSEEVFRLPPFTLFPLPQTYRVLQAPQRRSLYAAHKKCR